MKLFLIGLMVAGKSFLGKKISQSANLPFIDLDSEIERQEGLSITQIFSAKGNEYFRAVEADALRKYSMTKEFVMATGGGTPCFRGNMDFINRTGISVFLDTPVTEILKRLSAQEKRERPLLQGVSDNELGQTLESMLRERAAFYDLANFKVNGATVTASDILEMIKLKK